MQWTDRKIRCHWVNLANTTYLRYHDEEWGRPVHDDHILFEMLILENFQAGLTWECVLNKREAFRRAFDGFDLRKVASYSEEKLTALQADSGIIRNRLKIRAAVVNAQVFQKIQQEWGSFDRYLYQQQLKELEAAKTEQENLQIIQLVRSMNMKPDEFAAFLRSGALNAAPTATPYHKQEDAANET